MSLHLKPLSEQVLFINGANSELALETVNLAVKAGAHVFFVGPEEAPLELLQATMRAADYPTAYAVADLTEPAQLQVAVDNCLRTFGTIDTWINLTTPLTQDESARDCFEKNFWTVVEGSQLAVETLKHSGGSLLNFVNLSGETSQLAVAFKGAVKGFTEALRQECKEADAPVEISYIELTPEAKGSVGEILLKTTQHPTNELVVGAKSLMSKFVERFQAH